MAEVLTEQEPVHRQDCVAAGSLVGKLRIEMCRTAEGNYELEESHAGKDNLAAGVRTVVTGTAGEHIGAGSHCVLAEADEAAVAGIVALAGFVEVADTAASVGLDVVVDVAGIDVLGIVGHADTVAQDSFVGVAEPAA